MINSSLDYLPKSKNIFSKIFNPKQRKANFGLFLLSNIAKDLYGEKTGTKEKFDNFITSLPKTISSLPQEASKKIEKFDFNNYKKEIQIHGNKVTSLDFPTNIHLEEKKILDSSSMFGYLILMVIAMRYLENSIIKNKSK